MVRPHERVAVAVSGGADSVCLLHILLELNIPLAGVAHFNHKLRGEASEADAAFVRQLAERHSLPFFLGEAPLPEGNLEQEARRARQRFFRGLIRDQKASRVALGHTQDDQAETVLLRLMRGSGTAGLAGILPVTEEGLIRPLLNCNRQEIEAWLRANKSAWREDGSNVDLKFSRNRVRHQLLPSLAANFNPKIRVTLAHAAEIAREEESWWSAEVDKAGNLLVVRDAGVELDAHQLTALPTALARRLIRRAIQLAKGDLRQIEFQHIEKIRGLAARNEGCKAVRLPGLTVQRSLDWLCFARKPAAQPQLSAVTVPGSYSQGGSQVSFEVVERTRPRETQSGANPYGTLKVELSWNSITNPFVLEMRGWLSGDSYWPEGRARAYRVSELFQDARIPSWRRKSWPILSYRPTSGSAEILWAKGFGPARGWVAGEAYSGPVLRIWEKDESFPPGLASE